MDNPRVDSHGQINRTDMDDVKIRALAEAIRDISAELEALKCCSPKNGSTADDYSLKDYIERLYCEIQLILQRIQRGFQEAAAEGFAPLFQDVDGVSLNNKTEVTAKLKLDVKSLYIWCSIVHDALSKKNVRFSEDIQIELEKINTLTNNFIEHLGQKKNGFSDRAYNKEWAVAFTYGEEEIRILFYPFFPDNRYFEGLKELAEECLPYITVLNGKVNPLMKMQLIFQELGKLPPPLKSKANKFLVDRGISTEPPRIIADTMLKVLKAYRCVCESGDSNAKN